MFINATQFEEQYYFKFRYKIWIACQHYLKGNTILEGNVP